MIDTSGWGVAQTGRSGLDIVTGRVVVFNGRNWIFPTPGTPIGNPNNLDATADNQYIVPVADRGSSPAVPAVIGPTQLTSSSVMQGAQLATTTAPAPAGLTSGHVLALAVVAGVLWKFKAIAAVL